MKSKKQQRKRPQKQRKLLKLRQNKRRKRRKKTPKRKRNKRPPSIEKQKWKEKTRSKVVRRTLRRGCRGQKRLAES